MKLFAIALTLLCTVLMFFIRKEYKLALLFMASMLLTPLNLPIKSIPAISLLSLGFFFSEIPNWRIHWFRIRQSVILPYCILVIVSFLIAVITSPHLHEINNLGFFGISELLTKMMAIVYGYLALRGKRSLQPLLKVSFICLLIMTFLGIANYISGYSYYVQKLLENSFSFTSGNRFRVQASFNNPFDYGYMCVLLAIVHLYGYLQKMEDLPILASVQACCLFGVITCNCRTILVCYLVCTIVFALALQRNVRFKTLFFSGILLVGFLLFAFVPIVREMVLNMFSIFDTSGISDGSTLAMRWIQLGTVLYYIKGHWLFGRGVHFFGEELGWDSESGLEADMDLYGLEGIYLDLLLERGVIGFLLFLAILVLFLVFIFRYRMLGRKLYALGLSVLVLYILFSFMTGELHSAVPSYYIIGYVLANYTLRIRYLRKKRHAKPEEKPVL